MKLKLITLALAIPLLIASCGNNKNTKTEEETTETETTTAENQETTVMKTKAFDPATLSEEPTFEIVTSEGTITVKLYKGTPLHRDNFVKLASEKFYNGILFHRVINGFMIQTGDPLTKNPADSARFGTGGPGYTIPAEFKPEYNHKIGALAAARLGDRANPKKESSGSQFYIVQNEETCKQLDGQYTVFGETIDGFDVIDRIAYTQTNLRDKPLKNIEIYYIRPIKDE